MDLLPLPHIAHLILIEKKFVHTFSSSLRLYTEIHSFLFIQIIFYSDQLFSWGAMASESKVTLKSSDGELFDVTEAVAFESQTIKYVIEDTGTANAIPLPNVSSEILSKVIEYCKHHVDAQNPAHEKSVISEDEIKTWDEEFVKVDQATLFDLILVFCQKPLFDGLVFFEPN